MNYIRRAGKAVCVARNYAMHARELNNPIPSEAVFFVKTPNSFFAADGSPSAKLLLPPGEDIHHEVELCAIIGRQAQKISSDVTDQEILSRHVSAYSISVDATARDVQQAAKEKGMPWNAAKNFDTRLPLGPTVDGITDPQDLTIWLSVNGEVRQECSTSDMLRGVAQLVRSASQRITLEAGDLLLTGTPAGVASLKSGDKVAAGISGMEHSEMNFVCE